MSVNVDMTIAVVTAIGITIVTTITIVDTCCI